MGPCGVPSELKARHRKDKQGPLEGSLVLNNCGIGPVILDERRLPAASTERHQDRHASWREAAFLVLLFVVIFLHHARLVEAHHCLGEEVLRSPFLPTVNCTRNIALQLLVKPLDAYSVALRVVWTELSAPVVLLLAIAWLAGFLALPTWWSRDRNTVRLLLVACLRLANKLVGLATFVVLVANQQHSEDPGAGVPQPSIYFRRHLPTDGLLLVAETLLYPVQIPCAWQVGLVLAEFSSICLSCAVLTAYAPGHLPPLHTILPGAVAGLVVALGSIRWQLVLFPCTPKQPATPGKEQGRPWAAEPQLRGRQQALPADADADENEPVAQLAPALAEGLAAGKCSELALGAATPQLAFPSIRTSPWRQQAAQQQGQQPPIAPLLRDLPVEQARALAVVAAGRQSYRSPAPHTTLSLKLHFAEPEDLPEAWLRQLSATLQQRQQQCRQVEGHQLTAGKHMSGIVNALGTNPQAPGRTGTSSEAGSLQIVGAAVRRGCLQLTLELMHVVDTGSFCGGPAAPVDAPLAKALAILRGAGDAPCAAAAATAAGGSGLQAADVACVVHVPGCIQAEDAQVLQALLPSLPQPDASAVGVVTLTLRGEAYRAVWDQALQAWCVMAVGPVGLSCPSLEVPADNAAGTAAAGPTAASLPSPHCGPAPASLQLLLTDVVRARPAAGQPLSLSAALLGVPSEWVRGAVAPSKCRATLAASLLHQQVDGICWPSTLNLVANLGGRAVAIDIAAVSIMCQTAAHSARASSADSDSSRTGGSAGAAGGSSVVLRLELLVHGTGADSTGATAATTAEMLVLEAWCGDVMVAAQQVLLLQEGEVAREVADMCAAIVEESALGEAFGVDAAAAAAGHRGATHCEGDEDASGEVPPPEHHGEGAGVLLELLHASRALALAGVPDLLRDLSTWASYSAFAAAEVASAGGGGGGGAPRNSGSGSEVLFSSAVLTQDAESGLLSVGLNLLLHFGCDPAMRCTAEALCESFLAMGHSRAAVLAAVEALAAGLSEDGGDEDRQVV